MVAVNTTQAAASSHIDYPGWRLGGPAAWGMAVAATLIAVTFHDGIWKLLQLWGEKEEYSHAYLIPVLSLFLAWQQKNELSRHEWTGAWSGVALTFIGLLTFFVGALSTIYAVIHYALIITIAGTLLSLVGVRSFRYLWIAVFFLFFMVPLPNFLYQAVSTKLQLVSSEIGVAVIHQFGISVFLEGNVIDLGSFKLQVVEACNGLRYLFPLSSFGFLCAYLYRGPFWHKALLFLSTIPITVFMNSLRIGMIGVTVEYWGQEMAEGVLHDFEGWAIFMACLAVLFFEMWILARLQRPRRSFSDVFFVEIPAPNPSLKNARPRALPTPFKATLALLVIGVLVSLSIAKREEIIPSRTDFDDFPLAVGEWRGQRDTIEQVYLDALKLTDYVFVNYVRPGSTAVVNFYTAYYDSQRAGESAHSPRSCIPGGGWKIEDLSEVQIGGHAANRVKIAMGDNKQLVVYWFQQRGRIITNEYLVKWYLFWDALTKNRTDGALVRLTTGLKDTETWEDGDKRLEQFAHDLGDTLKAYVPN